MWHRFYVVHVVGLSYVEQSLLVKRERRPYLAMREFRDPNKLYSVIKTHTLCYRFFVVIW